MCFLCLCLSFPAHQLHKSYPVIVFRGHFSSEGVQEEILLIMFDVGILWTIGLFWVRMKSSNGLSCHLFSLPIFPRSNNAKKLAFRWGVHYAWEHHGAVIEGAAGMPVAAGEDFPLMLLSTIRRRKHIRFHVGLLLLRFLINYNETPFSEGVKNGKF